MCFCFSKIFKCNASGFSVVGSLLLGVATSHSDVDLVCVGHDERATFVKRVERVLCRAPNDSCFVKRNVIDTHVPVLVLSVTQVDIDIVYVIVIFVLLS